jgi:hypothetical protein
MTITLTREEAQQVLDALEYGIDYVKSEETTNKQTYKGYEHLCPDDSYYIKFIDDAMETLRARLSAPEPEPAKLLLIPALMEQAGWVRKREWQGLTDEERTYLAWESNNGPHCVAMTEAKLKEKNT